MDYQLRTHARARKLTLRLDKNGQVVVTVPRFTPRFLVKKFIAQHEDWILANQAKQQTNRAKFISETNLMLFGKQYALEIRPSEDASTVKIQAKTVVVFLHHNSRQSVETILQKFLKNTASHYLTPRIHQLAKKMKVDFKKITLRAQTTRWGSCSSRGSLNFNWKLVHFPSAVIDYVIVHELAHLKHMNHSTAFWQFVEQFAPDYRMQRGWLKRQGVGVG
ncbi:MAG: SprT family zinc-dependent metalloprotease [Candidatus Paceibacterota bacterium]